MVTIDELVEIHIKAQGDLNAYEKLFDDRLKKAIKDDPLATDWKFDCGGMTKQVITGLAPRYKQAGWLVAYYDYPRVNVSVSAVAKFNKTVKDGITAKQAVVKVDRAVKVVSPSQVTLDAMGCSE